MSYTYLFGDINFISIWDGIVTLIYNDKLYQYRLESNYQWYDLLYRNSYPKFQIIRIVKLSILNELKQYQIKEN